MTSRNIRISIEFEEGYEAYGEGIDGYAAAPYPELTQEMTDWFAGWIAARNDDQDSNPLRAYRFDPLGAAIRLASYNKAARSAT